MAGQRRSDSSRQKLRAATRDLRTQDLPPYFANHFKDILRQCEQYGIDHRLPMNQTPLMAAAAAGNVPLVEALLERGADRESRRSLWLQRPALGLARGFPRCEVCPRPTRRPLRTAGAGEHRRQYRRTTGAHRPASVRILHLPDAVGALQVALHPPAASRQRRLRRAGDSRRLAAPAGQYRPSRNATSASIFPSVLARNEINRDYAYNRALFMRVARAGISSIPNSRCVAAGLDEEQWLPIYAALNRVFAAADHAIDRYSLSRRCSTTGDVGHSRGTAPGSRTSAAADRGSQEALIAVPTTPARHHSLRRATSRVS
jgi:hypothetical protein